MKRYLFMALLLALASCDIVEAPYLKQPVDGGQDTAEVVRGVLLLDFTGHICQNCPEGHRVAQQLVDLYGDRLVPVSVHGGFFATPYTSGEKYRYDFRTPEGTELNSHFNVQAWPIGLVNTLEGNSLSFASEWPSLVAGQMELEPAVALELAGSVADGRLTCQAESRSLTDAAEPLWLAVWLLESHIIQWQKDGSQDIADYEHNHVLRRSLNGTWGQEMPGLQATGQSVPLELELDWDGEWVPANCELLAFVYGQSTGQVYQTLLVKPEVEQ